MNLPKNKEELERDYEFVRNNKLKTLCSGCDFSNGFFCESNVFYMDCTGGIWKKKVNNEKTNR